jgi:hypothetical protein
LSQVQETQQAVRSYVVDVQAIANTLNPETGGSAQRQEQFTELEQRFAAQPDPIHQQMAKVMANFQPGLFAGGDANFAQDNLDLERWFRLPKGDERRIHGHCHAGVRLVQEGPTLALALDAHMNHPDPFTLAELFPYRSVQPPQSQQDAIGRRKTMRRARSNKQRPLLLAELETRYVNSNTS